MFESSGLKGGILLLLWVATLEEHLRVVSVVSTHGWYIVQTLQCVRILRLLQLTGRYSGVRKLYFVTMISLPEVINLVLCNFCVHFIFGVIGTQMCGGILHDSSASTRQEHAFQSTYFTDKWGWQTPSVGRDDNFDTIESSIRVLFQISTGMSFRQLITDCQANTDNYASLVTIFFFLFFVISNFIFISLFVALLLDNLDLLGSEDFAVNDIDIFIYRESWLAQGLRLDQLMDASEIEAFVLNMKGTFNLVARADPYWHNRILLELGLTRNAVSTRGSTFVTFHELLHALCHVRFSSKCLSLAEEAAKSQIHQEHQLEHAARLVQCSWRAMLAIRAHPLWTRDSSVDIPNSYFAAVRAARLLQLSAIIRTHRVTAEHIVAEQMDQMQRVVNRTEDRLHVKSLAKSNRASFNSRLANNQPNMHLSDLRERNAAGSRSLTSSTPAPEGTMTTSKDDLKKTMQFKQQNTFLTRRTRHDSGWFASSDTTQASASVLEDDTKQDFNET
eukprot:SAG31_NODE_6599_length_1956_cov_1.329564_1_plen_503_part_10